MELVLIIIIFGVIYLAYADFSPKKPKVCGGCGDTNPQWEAYVIPRPSWSKKKAKVTSYKCKKCGYTHQLPIK